MLDRVLWVRHRDLGVWKVFPPRGYFTEEYRSVVQWGNDEILLIQCPMPCTADERFMLMRLMLAERNVFISTMPGLRIRFGEKPLSL